MNMNKKEGSWCFPVNSGAYYGFNGNTVDGFRDKRLNSLIRESCQNSLDAKDDSGKPVIVEYSVFDLPKNSFPGISDLEKHIKACEKIPCDDNSPTRQFLKVCSDELDKDKFLCLRISDFNTTGLRGSRIKEDLSQNSQWFCCVKSIGSSGAKTEGSAGSQGLGKATAFLNSAFRTVFYSTLDIEGNQAYEGVSHLINHSLNDEDILSSIGFYSCEQDNQPCRAIYSSLNLDPNFNRKPDECGTDVFVMALHRSDKKLDSLEDLVKLVVLESFLPAIIEGRFIVRCGKTEISKETLKEIIDNFKHSNASGKAKIANIDQAFSVMTAQEALLSSKEVISTDDLGCKGQIEIKLKLGEGLNNKVAIYREIGMKITDKSFKKYSFEFTGVLTIKGKELNCFMKNMENAAHDKWQKEAYTDDLKRVIADKILKTDIDQ